jgi:thiol-disulfide isomerase/thioredoxin
MQHGKNWLVIAALACLVFAYFFTGWGSWTGSSNPDNGGNETVGLSRIDLTGEDDIPLEECRKRGLYGQAVVLESEYCPACKKAKVTLAEVESETGISFLYVDLSASEGTEWMESRGLTAHYTPTAVINCEVLIGAHEKKDYLAALERAMGEGYE